MRAQERVGHTYGRLTIQEVFRKNKRTLANCTCVCGGTHTTRVDSLVKGSTSSCGCIDKSEVSGMKTHGMCNTRVYRIWKKVISRTTNPKDDYYSKYGGVGIGLTESWRSFINFYEDMGDPPSEDHSIDRIHNNKGYCKENCRWATRSIQSKNQNKRRVGTAASKYKGVCYDKRHRGCYRFSVTKDYTTIGKSVDKDEVLAAKLFNFCTKYLYGEEVQLNDVDEQTITIAQAIDCHSLIEKKLYLDQSTREYLRKHKEAKA